MKERTGVRAGCCERGCRREGSHGKGQLQLLYRMTAGSISTTARVVMEVDQFQQTACCILSHFCQLTLPCGLWVALHAATVLLSLYHAMEAADGVQAVQHQCKSLTATASCDDTTLKPKY